MTQHVLVVDFGAQYAQLIARRVREAHVYSEIVQSTITADEVRAKAPAAIILSGGPKSVYEVPAPSLDPAIYDLGIPVLGICYGAQLMAQQLGGDVANTGVGEYGRTTLTRVGASVLMDEWPASVTCWMSHGDAIATAPEGFVVTGSSPEGPVAVMEDVARRLHAVQFHPEVAHTERGQDLLANFLHHVAQIPPTWTNTSIIEDQVAAIRAQVGDEKVLCALSGGVDSAVAAALVTKAVGQQLTCVFVDTGLMRKDEGEQIEETFTRQFGVELIHVKAQDRFFEALAGVTDPEAKRKIIGELFIREFETVARELGKGGDGPRFLVQGTLYPDVIESGSGHAANIKSHHNVGGLPEDLSFDLVEPLRNLFKDEVRHVGEELGLPAEIVWRQPFPGPGLGRAHRGRGHARTRRDPAQRRPRRRGRDQEGGAVPRALAELRRVTGRAYGGGHGRRTNLRVPDHHPRRHERRRDDRRLGPPALRRHREDREPSDPRGRRRQPGRAGRDEQATGHH